MIYNKQSMDEIYLFNKLAHRYTNTLVIFNKNVISVLDNALF